MQGQPEPPAPPPAFDGFARRAAIVALVLSSAGLVACQIRSGLSELSLASLLFLAWPYGPYLVALAVLRRSRPTPLRSLGVVLVGLFGMLVYGQIALSERSGSTSALIFLFLPIWQFVGLAVALVVTEFVGRGRSGGRA